MSEPMRMLIGEPLETDDFSVKVTVLGRYIQCAFCLAPRDEPTYASMTFGDEPAPRWITPHRAGCHLAPDGYIP